jgi:hypothetical protein
VATLHQEEIPEYGAVVTSTFDLPLIVSLSPPAINASPSMQILDRQRNINLR